MTAWKWAAASLRGTSHDRTGVRLQDAFSCFVPKSATDKFVAIVSDGAGSAEFGGEGASLVCRSLGVRVRTHFAANAALPSDESIREWFDETRDLISAVASRREASMRDFASTAVFVISGGAETIIAHVGDGCAVLRDQQSTRWIAPSWPNHGEFAATTFFVTDCDEINLKITRYAGNVSALAVFSDGIERLVLDFAGNEPYGKFFNGIIAPVIVSEANGRDRDLSLRLRDYLGSDPVNARTDDDKTLVLAVRK